jgi:adenine deaminase
MTDLTTITAAAAGRIESDLIIRSGQVIDVFSGTIHRRDIAIKDGTIVHIAPSIEGKGLKEMDADGLYVCPGFIDAHIHIESSMLVPSRFAQAVIPHGTTAVVADPHEIANCWGMDGIEFMIGDVRSSALSFYFTAPSCVPAAGQFETSGAELGPEEIARALDMEGVVGLGEMMNFPGVINADPGVMEKIEEARRRNMVIDGHAPGLRGRQLSAYVAAGIDSDHEAFGLDEAQEKLQKGMYLFIRQGTSAKNLEALLPAVTPETLARCCLVTDDKHPDEILNHGHLDHLLSQAVALGLGPAEAVRMVTLNPAVRFGLKGHGAVAPGYRADIVLIEDLAAFRPFAVIISGQICYSATAGLSDICLHRPAPGASNIPVAPSAGLEIPEPSGLDLAVRAPFQTDRVRARVMEIVPGELITRQVLMELYVKDGCVLSDPGRDVSYLMVIERHHGTGNIGKGFVKGFNLQRGAIASTVAHDSHNLIIAGADQESMKAAAAALKASGGGLCAALGQKVELLALPVAGLMSTSSAREVARGLDRVLGFAHELGISMENPFMPLSFLALPVIPELKLTDKGLVDVNTFSLVPLFP